ncbi:MAG: valine--tRNA ligase [Myxococcaceae bacterium]
MSGDKAEELPKAYDPTEVERRWSDAWRDAGCFRADATSEWPPYCIILPPPNVTGALHIGHALGNTLQDVLVRWRRMRGDNVLWQPGTDHAGIATQLVVERELAKTEGKTRQQLGRAAFIERVWQWKEKYGHRINEQQADLGSSLDFSRERFTLDPAASRAVVEAFVRLHEEGLLYRAQRLINWCPDCKTAISDLEVDHEEVKGSLWEIRYPVKDSEQALVVATTRPETMLGDTAVAVHPDDPRYRHLVGKTAVLPLVGREIPIIADATLVSMEFGTGAVKVTPAHDFNDYETGLRHQLPMLNIFDDSARTNIEAGRYAGLDRFEARKRVLADLAEQGFLVRETPHVLSVGTCQRSGTVVEPRLSPQWFVRTKPLAEPAIAAVEQGRVKILPESWTSTYFHWMHNIHDWCVSRQLWWGHQIPAYFCQDCGPEAPPVVARSRPERCPRCGGAHLVQDEDVLDTWFSSALWPFSTLGWPQQTAELETFYPTSVLETGHDILFFWVARMMMMGLHFMKDVPFRTVFLHAMVRDEKGEKMSKVKGNVIDPLDVIHGAKAGSLPPALRNKFPDGMPAFGADALRYTLASLTQQGRDIRLSLERVNGYRAFANKLWNATRFALLNLGDFQPGQTPLERGRMTLADRWILARLEGVTEEVETALSTFQFADAASALFQFAWRGFCDWYIELAKAPLQGSDARARTTTQAVLVEVLDQLLRLLHPFMPFLTEELWHRLPGVAADAFLAREAFPEATGAWRDAAAEEEMAPVMAVIEAVRTIRGESNLSPAARFRAVVQSERPRLRESLRRASGYVLPLAGLAALEVEPPGLQPPQSATWVGEGLQVFVPLAGLLDLSEERARLGKELVRLETDLAGLRRKLDNPSFVAKAPAEVVEKDRARVAELEQRSLKVQENLNRIEPEGTMSEKTPEEMFQSTPPTPSSGMFGIPSEPSQAPSAPMAATPAPAPRKSAAPKKKAAARKKPKAKRAKKAAPRKAKRKAKRAGKRKAARKAPARKAKRGGRRKVVRRTTKRRGRR